MTVEGPATPGLLERDSELARLATALEEAQRSRGTVILVEGEPGLGKSSLLHAGGDLAAQAGFEVLRARGSELERDFPLGVAVQLFEARVRAADDGERADIFAGSARLAAPLFAGESPLAAMDQPAPGSGAAADFPLLHGLHWLASNLAERRPLALVVDDAHWSDRLSLRFLLYLAERIGELPVVVLAAARPREPGAEQELLAELTRHPAALLLEPGALSRDAVGRLAAGWFATERPPQRGFVEACHQVTGGNPLLVRELMAALGEERVPPVDASVPRVHEIGPEPVSRAIYLALRRLGPEPTALARAVAILDDGAEYVAAAELADLDLHEAARAAGALEAAGLFADSGNTLAFAHPILRAAVYEELTPSERAHAHHLAARILGEQGPLERVAAHLIASRPSRDPWAVVTLRRAAAEAGKRGAPDAAVRYLERAIAEPPADDQLPDVLLDLARVQAAAGLPGAPERFERALTVVDDPERRAAILLDLGRTLYAHGRFQDAADAFRRGLDEAADGVGELRLELESGFASAALWVPGWGARALERLAPLIAADREPRTLGERVVLANLAGLEMMRCEDHRRAVELARRAWGGGAFLAVATADNPALSAITGALIPSDALEEATAVATAALEDARRRGSILAFATASYLRAAAHLRTGRLDDAIADAEQALEGRRFGWEAYAAAAMWILALALIERGEIQRAAEILETPPEVEQRLSGHAIHATLLHARGSVALARGDAARALEYFRRAGDVSVNVLGNRNPALLAWQSSAALALARLGDRDAAIELVDEELAAARRYGAPRAIGAALRVRGLVEGGAGSVSYLEEACETLEGSGAQLELAHALVDVGTALRRTGKRAASREPLTRGLDVADRCRAAALAGRAREELVAAGARPRRARLSGPASLTPSERRVAAMAAEGLTNREIAEALFVTRKAVEYHMGNVFRKLDVSARSQLAGALAEESPA
jgi:DNA-binding CsgD family transcriptional regulator